MGTMLPLLYEVCFICILANGGAYQHDIYDSEIRARPGHPRLAGLFV